MNSRLSLLSQVLSPTPKNLCVNSTKVQGTVKWQYQQSSCYTLPTSTRPQNGLSSLSSRCTRVTVAAPVYYLLQNIRLNIFKLRGTVRLQYRQIFTRTTWRAHHHCDNSSSFGSATLSLIVALSLRVAFHPVPPAAIKHDTSVHILTSATPLERSPRRNSSQTVRTRERRGHLGPENARVVAGIELAEVDESGV
ncbi:hypothetical protein BC835DRAFT_1340958, partial [Cytidiella melzeri]